MFSVFGDGSTWWRLGISNLSERPALFNLTTARVEECNGEKAHHEKNQSHLASLKSRLASGRNRSRLLLIRELFGELPELSLAWDHLDLASSNIIDAALDLRPTPPRLLLPRVLHRGSQSIDRLTGRDSWVESASFLQHLRNFGGHLCHDHFTCPFYPRLRVIHRTERDELGRPARPVW